MTGSEMGQQDKKDTEKGGNAEMVKGNIKRNREEENEKEGIMIERGRQMKRDTERKKIGDKREVRRNEGKTEKI
jgi:hypothetical protein